MTMRWVVAGLFLAIFAYVTIVQLVYIVSFWLKKTDKHASLVPASIFGLIGLLLLPDPTALRKWFWVPLALDPFVYMLVLYPFMPKSSGK